MRVFSSRWMRGWTAAALIALFAVGGCTGRRHQDRFRWDEFVAAAVAATQKTEEPVYFDVVRIMPFEWEKFYMFPPGTSIDEIEKALGFKWRTAKKTRIHERNDITLLVFVIGRTVQDYIEQPLEEGDFSRLRAGHAYTPREGYFEVVGGEEGGEKSCYFVEAERYPKP